MSKSILQKLLSYPLILIGIIMMILGIRWMNVDEPWMLDKVANVERLNSSFIDLFSSTGSSINLEGYLTQIYRFFGFWVLTIGMLITSFSSPSIIIKKHVGIRLLPILGYMLIIGLYLGYTWIPSSHFIWLTWGLLGVYLLSLYAFLKLKNK
tara:strand:- start:166 stop:621 length:456 start_codon:yes stop_codon:yes gene_type:complete